ncbi:Superfamily I DNA/RNA helicase protein [Pseudomonas chlororaphis]|uniref:DEAD/DEAH box helicase n=1 Tax=Pseudomonas chlororaphis TaxID=587753 RepID=UPI0039E3079B
MIAQGQARLLDILDYWHKVEFFLPYALEKYVEDFKEWETRWLSQEDLQQSKDSRWRNFSIPDDLQVKGFNLYIGVFDASVIATLCEPHLAALSVDENTFYEEQERVELEGLTCFAKIKLNAQAVPQLDAVSLSTAPWALGQTVSKGLGALGHQAFEDAKEQLIKLLHNFHGQRQQNDDPALMAEEVMHLHQLLCNWASFTPEQNNGTAVALLQVLTQPKVEKPLTQPSAAQAPEVEDEEEPDTEIDILNSFFIKDIERAIASLQRAEQPLPLLQYLGEADPSKRIDLYTDHGRTAIYQALQPQCINPGHWPDEPGHAMSLMQQFAINTALGTLENSGMFSVNGPPGTGKTTLLRDMFAENIVRRARVLAGYSEAADAFVGGKKPQVTFKGMPNIYTIRALKPELTGYEMVVASSNNAAVENISRDLPKRKSLGKCWNNVQYLQPVAHKIAAQKSDGSISPLSDEDKPWGLICAALGNSSNRKALQERLFFNPVDTTEPNPPLTIRQWVDDYKGPTFKEACAAFKKADEEVSKALEERARYASLLEEMAATDEPAFLHPQQQSFNQAEQTRASAQQALDRQQQQLQATAQHLSSLQELERLIDRSRPVWWKRLFNTQAAKTHRNEQLENARLQRLAHEEINRAKSLLNNSLRPELESAQTALLFCKSELDARKAQWQGKCQCLDDFASRLGRPNLPGQLSELENSDFQINGLWHDAALNRLRSTVFAAALTLHEAWLAEVAPSGSNGKGFSANLAAISLLLSNKTPEDERLTQVLWQSLFMVIPVVSSTFASFGNQFRGLGAGSLGWLYIDEAGQAVPQAAVGALWRAQRAMVVGDPLQIEPVFTLPQRLVKTLGQLSAHTANDAFAPNRVSVQSLADQNNRYGSVFKNDTDEELWIGSPLRVHRRCIEPMFSLSNQIAYGNKMVFGLPNAHAEQDAPVYSSSCWVDIPGNVEHKQVVPRQIEFMVDLLGQLYLRDGELPQLYVISPFKAVRLALQKAIRAAAWARPNHRPKLPAGELKQWLKASIGTVHTFQGKEQDTVFMLLGADPEHAGAAQWAASKPNLLNVALTRAKRRVYLVGDFDLWGSLRYFDAVSRGKFPLQRMGPAAFLAKLNALEEQA